jgi:hypothetical protein
MIEIFKNVISDFTFLIVARDAMVLKGTVGEFYEAVYRLFIVKAM